MAGNGIAGFESKELVPDYTQVFTGFRTWKIPTWKDPHLWSVSFHYEWKPGVNAATCQASKTRLICGVTDHTHISHCREADKCDPVAQMPCGCGFWAYTTPTAWFRDSPVPGGSSHLGGHSLAVMGVIHGFGHMVLGTKGFRAEKAVIAGLVLPPTYQRWAAPWYDAGVLIPSAEQERRSDAGNAERTIWATEAADGVRAAFPAVPTFPTVEAMLAEIPLTRIEDLLDDPQEAA